jgi:hypothetical protein
MLSIRDKLRESDGIFFFQPKKICHRIGGSVEIESLYSFLCHFLKKYLSRNLSAD